MTLDVTILGCGASLGVPVVGCTCAVCQSPNPKNKRLRASLTVDNGDKCVLVDASPDLRAQCLANNIKSIDAVIITHAHADHCHGLDDIRALNFHKNGPIDLYADAATLAELKARFPYIFTPHNAAYGWYKPLLVPHIIDTDSWQPFVVADSIEVRPFPQIHGKIQTLGLRFENFAYSTDVNNLVEASFQAIENIDTWVVDCLQYKPAPTHAHLEQTLKWIERVKPRRAILTHMSHAIEYDEVKGRLPAYAEPAYDGMQIRI